MPGALDFLFGGTPPPSVTGSIASVQGVPDWYQEYLRGIAGQATSLAGMQADQAVPAQSIAGFTPDQIAAFQKVRGNQGAWQPALGEEGQILGGIQPQVSGAIDQANEAVAGPAQTAAGTSLPYLDSALGAASSPSASWTDNYQKYMSPYTSSVIDNIARLGTRNFNENIMPGVNRSMVAAGQFGSTRNADVLGRAARDASADITGQQATALEQGYGTSSGIFANDANRAQQQQQMRAQTGLGAASTYGTLSAEDAARQQQQEQMRATTAMTGGQLASSTGLNAAQQYGALGQATSGMGMADAQALAASGQQQENLDQAGLNTAYSNASSLNNYDWNILNNMNSVIRGMQLPTSTTVTSNQPANATTQPYGSSPLTQLGALYFGTGKAKGGRVMPRHARRAMGALSYVGQR
jgi:hypothetical protein